jgi:GNAT superfamily N-acetyltransferase
MAGAVDSDLATALAAERAIVRRGVERASAIKGGWVIRHPPLADVWHLNRVHLIGAAGSLDADALQALVTEQLAGGPYRRVTLDDAVAADALWPALQARGWRRERAVVMVASAEPSRPPHPAAAVREIDGSALAAFQPLAFADDAAVTAISAALPQRLADAQAVLRAGSRWRAFGAGATDASVPASTATLYLDPDVDGRRVAFVDQVATLRHHREQGLAAGVMAACLRAAAEWDASLVALLADAEDWPQLFYASLGFAIVARQTVFHHDAPPTS